MTRVKVCGITSDADRAAAVAAGADAVGVITDVDIDTPREVDPATAARIVADVPPLVTAVLVLVPDDSEHVVDLARTVKPDVLQLYGDFGSEDIEYVRAETGAKVMPVVDGDEPQRARDLDGVADALLVDSTREEGGGGTGETHDWDATAELVRAVETPVVLAGGLTPENVAEAVATVRPFAVDVASGVEARGGEKDHEAVEAFVRNATSAVVDA
ncbi:MAG: phosphoribosylanthranilate isomerase [Haloarculaceae archaeon]